MPRATGVSRLTASTHASRASETSAQPFHRGDVPHVKRQALGVRILSIHRALIASVLVSCGSSLAVAASNGELAALQVERLSQEVEYGTE